MRIGIYKPDYIVGEARDEKYRFHGYMTQFINKYADCIYAYSEEKYDIYGKAFKKLNINNRFEYVYDIEELNQKCDILVMPYMTYNLYYADEIKLFKGLKIQNIQDWYLDCSIASNFYNKVGIDYLIGHTQLDTRCPLFDKYYSQYKGKVIALPMGYSGRFRINNSFKARNNKALAVGTLFPIDKIIKFDPSEMLNMFPNIRYMTPVREFVYNNMSKISDCVDSLLPNPDKGIDHSFDIVKALNSYKMFINDECVFNMPLCKTYEGIACGTVMVASENDIYFDLGFVPEINYIGYKKGDYEEMIYKIRYYMKNEDKLERIQRRSLELAANYTHEAVAEKLYNQIVDIYKFKIGRNIN